MCGHSLRSVLVFLHQTYQWLWYFLFWIAIVTISCQTLKVSKWHTGIVFTLTEAPRVQRISWELKFWFELIFLSGLWIARGFWGGCQNRLGTFWIFLSGAVLSINDSEWNYLKLRYFGGMSQKRSTLVPHPKSTQSTVYVTFRQPGNTNVTHFSSFF